MLTLNEEKHIRRCINSAKRIADRVIVVDSFSTDATRTIALELGAEVYQRKFISHAEQFNWGLDNLKISTEWVMKLDADEYLEDDLVAELHNKLPELRPQVSGILLRYKLIFMGRWIRFGGRNSLKLVRIWRFGFGRLENRLMDEHVAIQSGDIVEFKSHFCDHNLNNFSLFIDKHNGYSVREAVEYLIQKYKLRQHRTSNQSLERSARIKRILKSEVYHRLPVLLAPFLYFFYRFFVLGGFLDGYQGVVYHSFQALWYRFLVAVRIVDWDRKIACLPPTARLAQLEELSGLHLVLHDGGEGLSSGGNATTNNQCG
ncbi:glycosyltransferase family 2 protein [Bradyrhizobium vignae]|uniref:glycosyltransferase family 2 protein n=1 Tax=Bradyrhizobium vignae TaxID=1549949 RepID=UPI0024BFFCC4|nr:glycosyltransferase family 2 protein [Bradyrhizobium vignae]